MIEEKDFTSDKMIKSIDDLLKNSEMIKNNLKKIASVDSEKEFLKEIRELLK